MGNYAYILLIPLLPFISFVLLGLYGKKMAPAFSGGIATILLLVSAFLSCKTAFQYFFKDGKVNGVYQKIEAFHFTWLSFSSGVSIDMSAIIDPVSAMMLVVVSFISLMVHLFSLGYMKGEERFATYYAFLGLFTFAMLGLVLSGNIFQVYLFWELVGVSSFLLIGYYFQKPQAVAAAKKAFIVTRFADLFFLIGILMLAFYTGTLDIRILIERLTNASSPKLIAMSSAGFLGASALTWALTLVFIGGAGKSAMFPLHIWLPDAMEGPTPVSALIHAATMVVAGVYLVARLYPVFSMDDTVLQIVTFTGIFSSFFAAIIACTQTDIKRVLAYSTMSQIGYMIFALGISKQGGENLGYMASLFHLFTHAFFKSLLFLCAGAVIHLIHSNEMKDMGGLRKHMPITHIAFLIACLAISGVPPFAGFFSKEEILTAVFHANKLVYAIALLTAGITAFYMFRLYFSIFWSKSEADLHDAHSEGTISMKIPLIILTLFSIGAGFIPFGSFVTANGEGISTHINILFSIAPVGLTLLAIALATYLYKTKNDKPALLISQLGGIYQTVYRKFYIDEIYLFITRKIIFPLIGRPIAWVDRNIVDGTVNGLANITGKISLAIKGLQSGKVQQYALYFFGGIACLAVLFIYLWK
jgi:NADH-quinone oxidoreductase subunit L